MPEKDTTDKSLDELLEAWKVRMEHLALKEAQEEERKRQLLLKRQAEQEILRATKFRGPIS